MPFYPYECNECKHKFEYFAKSISNPGHPLCPECDSEDTERSFATRANIKYVGSGFHVNDYPSDKKKMDKIDYLSSD